MHDSERSNYKILPSETMSHREAEVRFARGTCSHKHHATCPVAICGYSSCHELDSERRVAIDRSNKGHDVVADLVERGVNN